MPRKGRHFKMDEEDAARLQLLVSHSDADNGSQWLRRVLKQLANAPNPYVISDIVIQQKK